MKFGKDQFKVIVDTVIKTERSTLLAGKGRGWEKKKEVLDLLDKMIEFPFPLSLFERRIMSLLIDVVVYCFNWSWGRVWPKTVIIPQEGRTPYFKRL